jgi:hypothetical protein
VKLPLAGCRLQIGVFALAASLAGGCIQQERSVVSEFFTQSRLRDKTALQKIATVIFEPHIQGIVQTFTITKVTPEENDSTTVSVSAEVKLPDGTISQRLIVLTISRGLVTGFIDRPAFPASPAPPRS